MFPAVSPFPVPLKLSFPLLPSELARLRLRGEETKKESLTRHSNPPLNPPSPAAKEKAGVASEGISSEKES